MNNLNALFGTLFNSPFDSIKFISPIDKGILGEGIKLISLNIKNNENKYGNLYKNGKKISNKIFRIGGLSSGFNGKPYCMLIYYKTIKSSGQHCVIDSNGKIVFISESFRSPYYLNGHIVVEDNKYYSLLDGKMICGGYSSVSSDSYLFVEVYKEHKKVIYKIEYKTGTFEIFE